MKACIMVSTGEEISTVRRTVSRPQLSVRDGLLVMTCERTGWQLLWVVIGSGEDAALGCGQALDVLSPDVAVLAGAAIGIDPALNLGDVVVVDRVVKDASDLPVLSIDSDMCEAALKLAPVWQSRFPNVVEALGPNPVITSGSIVTVDDPAITAEDRSRLAELGYACADSESYAVAQVMAERNTPFAIYRAVAEIPGVRASAPGVVAAVLSIRILIGDMYRDNLFAS